jgi:predicted unusual protein kinase regulating ubiquinone biosynthesis (AarF/ABC1/UbiB family)
VLLWLSDRKYSNTVMQAEVLSLRSTLQQLEAELQKEIELRLEAEAALELSEAKQTRLQVN